MPFKSQAQQRAAFGGHLGPEMQRKAPEWAHETPNINKLPKHVRREDSPMEEEPQMDPSRTLEMDPMQQASPVSSPEMHTGVVDPYAHPGCEDVIGDIYIVLKPSADSNAANMVHKTHAFGIHQFDPHTVHGVYNDEGEAAIVAESALKELHKHLAKVEKKKDSVLERIGKHIHKLQKEINDHMKLANSKPEEADAHHMLAEKKMGIIRNLRDKHKLVKAAKRELPKKDKE